MHHEGSETGRPGDRDEGGTRDPRLPGPPSPEPDSAPANGSSKDAPSDGEPPRGLRAVVSSFRHRNFRLFFVGQLISLVGTWMQNVAQGWLVYDLTGQAKWLGRVSAAGSLPMLFLALYAGVVADRRPKRSVLVLTATGAMLLALILAALAYTRTVTVWHVLVLAFLLGSVNAFDMPARQAFVIEMVGREDLMNCIALNSAMFNGARIAGPAIAAQVLVVTGVAGCFFVNGLSYIAVIIALLMMRLPAFVPPQQSRPALGQLREAFAYIRWQPMTLTLIALMIISGLFGSPYQVLMPVFARTILNVGARGYGYLLSASGVGALLGALMVSMLAHQPHKERLLYITVPVFALATLAFAWSRWLPLSLALLVVASWMMMMQFATANTLIQTYVPDELRGRVLSVYILAFQGTWPFGSIQLGQMAQWLGGSALGTPRSLTLSVGLYGLLATTLLLVRRRALAVTDVRRPSSVVHREQRPAHPETCSRGTHD